jgi:hypothetical protein
MFKKREKKRPGFKQPTSIIDNSSLADTPEPESTAESQQEAQSVTQTQSLSTSKASYVTPKPISKLDQVKLEMRNIKIENRKIGSTTQIEETPEVMISFQRQNDTDKDLNEYIEKRITEIEAHKRSLVTGTHEPATPKPSKMESLLDAAKNRMDPAPPPSPPISPDNTHTLGQKRLDTEVDFPQPLEEDEE